MRRHFTCIALSLAATTAWVGVPAIAQEAEQSAERAAQQTESAAENAGQAIEQGAERAGQAVERGVERTGDAIQEAGRDVRRETGQAVDAAQAEIAEPQGRAGAVAGAALQFPNGIAAEELDDAEDLRDLLGSATEAAFTKGGFNDLVERLNDQDRNRLGKRDLDDLEPLNGRIDQLRTAFREKYGAELDIEDDQAFVGVTMLQGEVRQPLAVMRSWPVPATAQQAEGPLSPPQVAVPAGAVERPTTPLSEDRVEAANLEEGREVALAHFPGQQDLAPLTISIVGEAQGWKIDIPNHIGAGQLYQNLLNHLTYLGENVQQWPADRLQAERLLGHHVMMALYDVPVEQAQAKGGQQQQQQQEQQPQRAQ